MIGNSKTNFWFKGLIIIATCTLLQANTVTLHVQVDKKTLSLQDTLTYEVKVNGIANNDRPTITLPELKNQFAIVSSSEYTYISIQNGQASHSKSYRYILKPFQTGEITLSPTQVSFNGKKYLSQAITILITNKQTPSSPAQNQSQNQQISPSIQQAANRYNLFAKASLSKNEAYIGEQITYTVKFFRRVRIFSDINFSIPTFENFWVENLTLNPNDQPSNINGHMFYERDLINNAIFALKAGEYMIQGPKVSFILNPFEGQSSLQANNLKLKIKELPQTDKPDNFSGLIGEFNLKIDPIEQNIEENTPFTIKLNIEGQGNINSISELNFESNLDFKIYKSSIKDDLNKTNHISGKRQFEYTIIPKKAGVLYLPSFTFNYFSPNEQRYKKLNTKRFVINVKKNPNKLIQAPSEKITLQKEMTKKQDIHYLKSIENLKDSPFFWEKKSTIALLSSNIFFFLLLGSLSLKNNLTLGNSKKNLRKNTLKEIEKKLDSFTKKNKTAPLALIQNLLLDLLEIHIGPKAKSQSKTAIINILEAKTLPPAYINELTNLWDELNYANYSQSSLSEQSLDAFTARLQKLIYTTTELL